jgi:hypothetical protein
MQIKLRLRCVLQEARDQHEGREGENECNEGSEERDEE